MTAATTGVSAVTPIPVSTLVPESESRLLHTCHLSACLSLCQSACLLPGKFSVYLSASLPVILFLLHVCLRFCVSGYMSVGITLSLTGLPVCQFVCMACPPECLSLYQSACLQSVWLTDCSPACHCNSSGVSIIVCLKTGSYKMIDKKANCDYSILSAFLKQ